MVELQILNKVISSGSLTILRQNNITEDYFVTYREEFNFIINHQMEYGNIPDRETVIAQFPDFDFIEVAESDKYLVEKLQEQHLYSKMVPFIKTISAKVTEDAFEAVQYARREIETTINPLLSAQFQTGYDIVKNAEDRGQEHKRRLEVKGLLGIPTGLDALDEITHGWLNEDFVTVLGRTNEGKTWILLFFLVAAWKAGKRVLLYSGEMSKEMMGFRFDTLNEHFSNLALMHGGEKLDSEGTKNPEDYYNYLNDLKTRETPFIVVTPKDLGGHRLTVPTLHQLIETYKPDIVGVDQLSLMEDYRAAKGEQTRIKYTHIAEDLYLTSEKYQIPVMSPVQANRDSVKSCKEDDKAPGLEHVSESDGIGQNSTRTVSIKKIDNTLKISLPKNRYGLNNQEILVIWDIDNGVIKPFLSVQVDKDNKVVSAKPASSGGVDLF